MALAALSHIDAGRSLTVARSLGYGREAGWLKSVFPRVYAQIRLPVYVVLAYSMTVVDVAMILGPNTPPTLSVQLVRWMADPDLTMRLQAAAAALLQLAPRRRRRWRCGAWARSRRRGSGSLRFGSGRRGARWAALRWALGRARRGLLCGGRRWAWRGSRSGRWPGTGRFPTRCRRR